MFEATLSRREVAEARCGGRRGSLHRLALDRSGRRSDGSGATLETVRWISPRGTLQVMDDFNLWVPIKMGYFKELGIDVELIAGSVADALASTVRGPEPGRHGLPVARRAHRVDRQRHRRQVDLGHDLRVRSSTSGCLGQQHHSRRSSSRASRCRCGTPAGR